MKVREFKNKLENTLRGDLKVLQDKNNDWVVKGFIDIYKNIYTISIDTKVISKIIELMLFPTISKFARSNKLKMVLAEYQNFYLDITFIDERNRTVCREIGRASCRERV